MFAGFVILCVEGRLRGADAQRLLGEPVLDVDHKGWGFIEFGFRETKTSVARNQSMRLLQGAALALGPGGGMWAREWIRLRRKQGLDVGTDGCMMLTPNPEGEGWLQRKLTMTEATTWMRSILKEAGVGDERLITVAFHSLKATLLSWCAKAGIPLKSRRLLGHHAKRGDKSVLEYSRDAMAGPLRELEKIRQDVFQEVFLPDETRSGRYRATQEEAATSSATPSIVIW